MVVAVASEANRYKKHTNLLMKAKLLHELPNSQSRAEIKAEGVTASTEGKHSYPITHTHPDLHTQLYTGVRSSYPYPVCLTYSFCCLFSVVAIVSHSSFVFLLRSLVT